MNYNPFLFLNSSQPIGIFDSGIGGLTVANAIHKLLPSESLIYYGDTAHFPYGDKSPEAISAYSKGVAEFLLTKNCKAIVIACNTASSLGFDTVKKLVGNSIPVINVIDPVIELIRSRKDLHKVGVIGTRGTIKSKVYEHKLLGLNQDLQVQTLATPLLAPMIEEGFFNNNISKTIIHSYLSRPKLKKIDVIVLACTHYPLIKPEIVAYYKDKVEIIDNAQVAAIYTKKKLAELNLLSNAEKPKHLFYVSDFTTSFQNSTKVFFADKVNLELKNIWK